jgi:hypothetical protein
VWGVEREHARVQTRVRDADRVHVDHGGLVQSTRPMPLTSRPSRRTMLLS